MSSILISFLEKVRSQLGGQKAIIVPLHKKGDPNDMDNYRGISLLSVLGKVFTFILNKRLTEWTVSNDVLSDAQAGFRKTYSTTDHIFTMNACNEKYMLRNGEFCVAYVDFSKAFDTVRILYCGIFC